MNNPNNEPAAMRLQLAINVSDLDAAVDFYSKIFAVEVNKRQPGYANFVIDQPALKLVLFENPEAVNQLNHLGVEVFDDAEIDTAATRLRNSGLIPDLQQEQTCCYAKQNKAVVYDPDGTMWEWYRVLEDAPTFFADSAAPAEKSSPACC